MNNNFSKNKGIALILLIVTIICFIILIGVIILIYTNNMKAKENIKKEVQNEVENSSELEKTNNEKDITKITTQPPINQVNEKTIYKDKNSDNKIAIIPKGFKVSNNPEEQNIDKGLVVIAPDESEFVWIPVEDITKMYGITEEGKKLGKLYDFKNDGTYNENNWTEENGRMKLTSNMNYREPDVLTSISYGDWSETKESGINLLKVTVGLKGTNDEIKSQWIGQLQSEFDEMIKYVEQGKGFYISRYEMSVRDENSGKKIPQSKSGVISSSAYDNDTRTWYGLYQRAKEYAEKNNLTEAIGSSMIWGSQYDQMMIWMQSHNYNTRIDITNTTPIKGTIKNTTYVVGSKLEDKLFNIYDLLGSRMEWTIETTNDHFRVLRRR